MNIVYRLALQAALFILFAVALVPALTSAQEYSLEATIRAAVMSDPQSQSLSESEIDALVAQLTAEAERNGMTSGDILWRPGQEGSSFATSGGEQDSACTTLPGFLCALNEAFGFSGDSFIIPVALFALSMLLIILLAFVHHNHHSKIMPPIMPNMSMSKPPVPPSPVTSTPPTPPTNVPPPYVPRGPSI